MISLTKQIFLISIVSFDVVIFLRTNATESQCLVVKDGGLLMARVTAFLAEVLYIYCFSKQVRYYTLVRNASGITFTSKNVLD